MGQFRGISNGPNSRSLDDTLAETGPGMPDDAGPMEELSGADADRMAERLRERGWTRRSERRADGDESEAHPS